MNMKDVKRFIITGLIVSPPFIALIYCAGKVFGLVFPGSNAETVFYSSAIIAFVVVNGYFGMEYIAKTKKQ